VSEGRRVVWARQVAWAHEVVWARQVAAVARIARAAPSIARERREKQRETAGARRALWATNACGA